MNFWRIWAVAAAVFCLETAALATDRLPGELLAALPPESHANDRLVFDVLMDGRNIGTHGVTIWREGARTYVDIGIDLRVGLGPITLYRYEQRNTALWEGGALVSFVSRTDDDGVDFTVMANRGKDGLNVVVNDQAPVVVGDWFPTTYWDKRTVLQNRLLATRDGEVLDVAITPVGMEEIELRGAKTRAEKFTMRGDLNIDLWYDEAGRWVKLAFDYRGNRFDYVLR